MLYEQNVAGTTYNDTNVVNGDTYYYEVSAANGIGESNLSNEVTATPLPPLPAVPASVTVTALSSSQINLSWTEAAGTATSITIERSTNEVNFTQLTTLDGMATSFVDANGIVPGATYDYEISATNLAGTSALSSLVATQPVATVSAPWSDIDVGSPTLAGSAFELGGTLTVNGAGSGVTGTSDQFHFVYLPLSNDQTIVAQVPSEGNDSGGGETGVMIRSTLAANSAFAMMALTPLNGAAFESRTTRRHQPSNPTYTGNGTYSAGDWVKLVRSGSSFTGYVSTDGSTWTQVGSPAIITMGTSIFVGLLVTSNNTSETAEATFDRISIDGSTAPAAPSGLTANAASGTSVTLNWTDNDHYSFADEVYEEAPARRAIP